MNLTPCTFYKIILADPPWPFDTYSEKGQGRSPSKHYPTMTIEQIKNLPVKCLTDENCSLFMWTTSPHLKTSFEVIEEWGFTYKTVAFVWVKGEITHIKQMTRSMFDLHDVPVVDWELNSELGTGYWTRANAEYCLLSTRGHPKRVDMSVKQIIFESTREHSRKPDCTRDRIVQLMGDLPRVELFARQSTPGWDVWGKDNNITNDKYVESVLNG